MRINFLIVLGMALLFFSSLAFSFWEPQTIIIPSAINDLNELKDVNLSGLTDGQLIQYDSVSGKWLPVDVNSATLVGPVDGAFNGFTLQTTEVDVSSNGTDVNLNLDSNSGTLTLVFDDGLVPFTVPATVGLTVGTDSVPVLNYVFIPQSTETLTANTTGYPSGQHVAIATVLVPSAATIQTQGTYKLHVWEDHITNPSGQGHIYDIDEWIRIQPATYQSGVQFDVNIVSNGPTDPDSVQWSNTSGVVYQLHEQVFPAFDVNGLPGSDRMYVVNDPFTPFVSITDLNEITTDSNGGSFDNRFYNLVIWGSVSENNIDSHLFVNLPNDSYANQTDADNDVDATSNFDIPIDFQGTGFLIARLTFRKQTAGGGTFTLTKIVDLRGVSPAVSVTGGGIGGPTVTDFADSQFSIFNVTDASKVITYDISPVTTSTTRLYSALDADGVLALSTSVIPQHAVPFGDPSGLLSHDVTHLAFVDVNDSLGIRGRVGIQASVLETPQGSLEIEQLTTLPNLYLVGSAPQTFDLVLAENFTGSELFRFDANGELHPGITVLSDVTTTTPTDNQVLVFENGEWINSDLNVSDLNGNFTPGSVIFAGSNGGLDEDNIRLFWNDANHHLGVRGRIGIQPSVNSPPPGILHVDGGLLSLPVVDLKGIPSENQHFITANQFDGDHAFTFDGNGNLLVGDSNVADINLIGFFQTNTGLTIKRNSALNFPAFTLGAAFIQSSSSTLDFPGVIGLGRTRGTVDAPAAVVDGDNIGRVSAGAFNPLGSFTEVAKIDFLVDGTPSGTSIPGEISFQTAQIGQSAPTEAVRIEASHNVFFDENVLIGSTGSVNFPLVIEDLTETIYFQPGFESDNTLIRTGTGGLKISSQDNMEFEIDGGIPDENFLFSFLAIDLVTIGQDGDVTFNVTKGNQADFRVKGDFSDSLFFVDTAGEVLGIQTDTPFTDFASSSGDFTGTFTGLHTDANVGEGILAVEGLGGSRVVWGDSGGAVSEKIIDAHLDSGRLDFRIFDDNLSVISEFSQALTIDLASGKVGIGDIGTPNDTLSVDSESGSTAVRVTAHDGAPLIRAVHSGGTRSAPTQTLSSQNLFQYTSQGNDGVGTTSVVARMRVISAEDFTPTATGAFISFDTTDINSTVLANRLQIREDGHIRIGDVAFDVGRLGVVGQVDEVQLGVRADANQSLDIVQIQDVNGDVLLAVDSNGLIRVPDGNDTSPSYTFNTDRDTGFYLTDINEVALTPDDTLLVDNVGLNTAPHLTIEGDVETLGSIATGGNTDEGLVGGDINVSIVYYDALSAKSPIIFLPDGNEFTVFCYYAFDRDTGSNILIGEWTEVEMVGPIYQIEEFKEVNHPACLDQHDYVLTKRVLDCNNKPNHTWVGDPFSGSCVKT